MEYCGIDWVHASSDISDNFIDSGRWVLLTFVVSRAERARFLSPNGVQLRITGGQFRGRILTGPKGSMTRPTSDRVRESLFAIIGDRIRGARLLDCFSGTGAIGLEALSRGASRVTLIEQDRQAMMLIRKNAESLGLQPETVMGDFFRVARKMAQGRRKFDFIFVDPPYKGDLQHKALSVIEDTELCAEGGWVIVERDKRYDIPESMGALSRFDERRYGETILSFYTTPPGSSE